MEVHADVNIYVCENACNRYAVMYQEEMSGVKTEKSLEVIKMLKYDSKTSVINCDLNN